FFLLLPILLVAVTGCGGLHHLAPVTAERSSVEPYLVQLVDAPPGEASVRVSLSIRQYSPSEPMAESLSEEELAGMRAYAAERGAESLLVERVETPWRKAFYGTGFAPQVGAAALHAVPSCEGAAFQAQMEAVGRRVGRCLRDLKKARPALIGEATVRMMIDGAGGVYSAGVSPDSSRDGEVRNCFLKEAWRGGYGASATLLCGAEFSGKLPSR
ncbi:MAG: hypothetical protein VX938_06395, partial [Myxococcota bacterium]|nr:hypothetical protein [Myxococcota bacterium]